MQMDGTGGQGSIGVASGAPTATRQSSVVRRAAKSLLKQVEETRRRYAEEVDGLRSELSALGRQAAVDKRDADLAAVTAAAARRAAADATDELERINTELQRAKRSLAQANRYRLCLVAERHCQLYGRNGTHVENRDNPA
jgi:hypothetical protein